MLSGMSTLEQVQENVKNMKDSRPLGGDDMNMLLQMAKEQKATGPEGIGDFAEYEDLTYHGISVAAILDTYNSAMVQPNPLFSGEQAAGEWGDGHQTGISERDGSVPWKRYHGTGGGSMEFPCGACVCDVRNC